MEEIKRTLGDTKFGSSLDGLSDGDLDRGYSDEMKKQDTPDMGISFDVSHQEPGFLHRPLWKADVERN